MELAYLLSVLTFSNPPGPPSLTGQRSDHPEHPPHNVVRPEDLSWMHRKPAPVVAGPSSKASAAKKLAAKNKLMKRPTASDAVVAEAAAPSPNAAAPSQEDIVSLPDTPQDDFEAVPAVEATPASGAHGAPPGVVVPALPANPKKRKAPGWLPLPAGAREKMAALKHSKCRSKGCPDCRKKIGLILNTEETEWIWDPALQS